MKYIITILLFPLYLIIKILKRVTIELVEFATFFSEPIAEWIGELIDNMYEFWKGVFKWK